MTNAEHNAIVEACAVAAEERHMIGQEWVPDSLWAAILGRAAANVRRLKKPEDK